jgi:hypothetical protein
MGENEISNIIDAISNIFSKGLALEQREIIMRNIPIEINLKFNFDYITIYPVLWNFFQNEENIEYLFEIARRIDGIRNFYRNVDSELNRLRFIVNQLENKVKKIEKQKIKIFVLLPFTSECLAIYESAIKPSMEELGCSIQHAKEANTVESIINTIYSEINKASFIIADTTNRNPNVFYEIGYSHAIGKKVILITQKPNENNLDIPFNISGLPHILYKQDCLNALSIELKKIAKNLINIILQE